MDHTLHLLALMHFWDKPLLMCAQHCHSHPLSLTQSAALRATLLVSARASCACRECILADIEVRQKCPLCRTAITAQGLREGVLPGTQDAAAAIVEEAAVQDQAGPSTRRNPGGTYGSEKRILLESKLNVLLNEVRSSWVATCPLAA